MSIASEKVKFNTQRFLLVRLNPGRYILPVLNGSVYEITLPFTINDLKRNGVALTKDIITPSVNDHWYQDEDTGLLQVKLASAPNATSNVLVAFYYLFYTGTETRTVYEDPEDSATPFRDWAPRILNYPSTLQSFDNILQGIFSISDISLDIINESGDFQEFLTDDDSFFNKAVDIWLCIESIANIQRIFRGTIKKVNVSQNVVTISCADTFNKLNQPALMGDNQNESYASLAGFADIDANKRDYPIPYIVGPFSRYLTSVATEPVSTLKQIYSVSEGNEAFDISFAAPPTTSNNRGWLACRQKSAVATQSFGAITRVTVVGAYKFVEFASLSNLMPGDTIKYGATSYALVKWVGTFSYSGNGYNVIIDDISGTFVLASVVTAVKSFAVTVQDNTTSLLYELVYERDFSIDDSSTTSGGNRFVKINFTNNFEGTVGMPGALDSSIHKVFYRSTNASPETHGQILKDFLDKVGIPYDAATFTAADVSLVTNAAFAIPNFDEDDFDTYLKYAQNVLGSTLGFLRVNSDFEAQYYLLVAPNSVNSRDSSLILQDTPGCDIEYQDIVTTLIGYNPHNSSEFETMKVSTPSETRSNNKSKWLNEIENVDRFRHVLQTITDRIDAHIGIKSIRFAKYHLETATEDIDSELGDDLQLDDKIVLGSTQISDVKIVGIQKSPGKIAMDASDLKGL